MAEVRALAAPEARQLTPEQELIAAVIRTALNDAMHQGKVGTPGWHRAEEARAWLRQREIVVGWLTMAGLDEHVYEQMLRHVARGKHNRGPWRG